MVHKQINENDAMPSFPDCFPINFEEKLLNNGARHCLRENVYRILRYGVLNRDAFLSTIEEKGMVRRPGNKHKNSNSSYSTSVYDILEAAQNRLDLSFRNEPNAKIAVGNIVPESGLSTDPNPKTRHIDWWIYKDFNPEMYFKEVI